MLPPWVVLLSHMLSPSPDSLVRHVLAPGPTQLSYVQVGALQPERGTALFIHGSPGDAMAYKALLKDSVLRTQLNLVSVDRPGYGQTPPRRAVGSLAEQARRIAQLLPHLPRPVVVVGHSYGGPVALQLALDHPTAVDALVLVAASVDPALEDTAWYQHVAQWPLLRWALPTDLVVCNEEILALPPELARQTPRLPGLHLPVVVVQGGRDNLVPPANADYLARHLPRCEVRRYPELNHFIPFTQPELVRTAILRALPVGVPSPQP